jgi:large subunit ribosomal protein L3
MKIGLLGRKIGMTRVYDSNGKATPVTVIEAGGNSVVQVKTPEKEGYNAIQVGFETQKESRLNKAELGHFKKAAVEPKKLLR